MQYRKISKNKVQDLLNGKPPGVHIFSVLVWRIGDFTVNLRYKARMVPAAPKTTTMMGMMGMVLPPFGDYLMSQRKQPFLVIPATSVSKSSFSTAY